MKKTLGFISAVGLGMGAYALYDWYQRNDLTPLDYLGITHTDTESYNLFRIPKQDLRVYFPNKGRIRSVGFDMVLNDHKGIVTFKDIIFPKIEGCRIQVFLGYATEEGVKRVAYQQLLTQKDVDVRQRMVSFDDLMAFLQKNNLNMPDFLSFQLQGNHGMIHRIKLEGDIYGIVRFGSDAEAFQLKPWYQLREHSLKRLPAWFCAID